MKKSDSLRSQFFRFLLCNLTFFMLQFLYIFCSESSFIHAVSYPLAVYLELLGALAIQISLYTLLSLLQTALLWAIVPRRWPVWQAVICFLVITTLISVNCLFFPLSTFSRIFLPAFPVIFFKILLLVAGTILAVLAFVVLWKFFQTRYLLFTGIIGVGVLLTITSFFIMRIPQTPFNTLRQPNLLIIGVDSISPDAISYEHTPNLYQFLQQSVHFKETISPLARTYSAWTSLLTGLYPLHHFARENLYPAILVKNSASFAWDLQRMGYFTLFASDDRRFNNLGKEFGFQEIVGPHIGVNDVFLGSFYDFPLSNLFINTRISQWFLPYNYSNRAGYFSYFPSTFDHLLQRTIKNLNKSKPLFMAVHFTLPHWPYAWASSSPAKVNDEYDIYAREELYGDAVRRVDSQVGALLKVLENSGALNNSLVIVLSDHGEALYKQGARKTSMKHYQGSPPSPFANYLERKTYTELEKSAGHGSDLLSPAQYHCLLGFKYFRQGVMVTKPQSIDTRVAIIDIAPTIAAFFNFSLREVPDGISLWNTIMKHIPPKNHRKFLLESGMLPNQSLSKKKIIEYAKSLFEVNPRNNHVEIRATEFAKLNAMKLYGLLQDNWIIALYPDEDYYITVLLNLDNNEWTDDLDSTFAKSSPAQSLLQKLRQFYSHDLSSWPKVHALNTSIPSQAT